MKKRLLGFMLVLVMVISCLPFYQVFAASKEVSTTGYNGLTCYSQASVTTYNNGWSIYCRAITYYYQPIKKIWMDVHVDFFDASGKIISTKYYPTVLATNAAKVELTQTGQNPAGAVAIEVTANGNYNFEGDSYYNTYTATAASGKEGLKGTIVRAANTYCSKTDYAKGTQFGYPAPFFYDYVETGSTGCNYSAVVQLYTADNTPMYDFLINAEMIFYDGAGKQISTDNFSYVTPTSGSWYKRWVKTGTLPANAVSYELKIISAQICGPARSMSYAVILPNLSTGKVICAK